MVKDSFNEISRAMLFDSKRMYERVIKLGEEVGELNEAFLKWTTANGMSYKGFGKPQDVAEEAIDVILVAESLLYELYVGGQVTLEELDEMRKRKIKKWEEKCKED